MKFKLILAAVLALAPIALAQTQSPYIVPNNTLSLGKTGAANKTIEFNLTKSGASANPKIIWNNSLGALQFSNDGSTYVSLGAGGFTNPMTTLGDLLYGASSGTPTRLGIGSSGQVLTVTGGVPAWAPPTGGFTNPMTTLGDLILGGSSGTAGRLAIGGNGTALTSNGTTASWSVIPTPTPYSVFTSGASGLAPASGGGTTNFLRADGTWTAPAGGGSVTSVGLTAPSIFTVSGSPVTGSGVLGLTYSGSALPLGNGGTGTAAGSANAAFNALSPITAIGDLIYGSNTGVNARLPAGTNGSILSVVGGQPAWTASPTPAPTPGISTQAQAEATPTQTTNIQAPNNQLTTTAAGTRLIETGDGNILVNQNFQATAAQTGWTVSNSTPTNDTTSFVDGEKQSLKLTLSAQSGIILNQTVTPPTGMEITGNWEYNATFKTTLTSAFICPVQNMIEISASCVAAIPDGVYHSYPINYPASAVSNGLDIKVVNSSTGTVNVAKAYVGPARNIGSTNSSDAIAFANNIAGGAYTGNTTFPFTNVLIDTSGGFSAGAYTVKVASTCTVSANVYSNTTASDGLLIYKNATVQGSGYGIQATVGGNYSIAVPPVTFVAAANDVITAQKSKSVTLDAATQQYWISIRCTPTAGSQVVLPSQQGGSYWSGYHSTTTGWSTALTSYVDTSNAAGVVLTSQPSRNISCVTASGTLPGITCTFLKVGNFKVCSFVQVSNGTVNGYNYAQMVDGSGAVVAPGKLFVSGTASQSGQIPLCSTYAVASIVSPTTFKLQIHAGGAGGTETVGSNVPGDGGIQWTVEAVDGAQNAPIVIGSVTSNAAGAIRDEVISFGGSTSFAICNSSPCTTFNLSASNWATVTRASAGNYNIVIPAGTFSSFLSATTQIVFSASSAGYCGWNTPPTITGGNLTCYNQAGGSLDTAGIIEFKGFR